MKHKTLLILISGIFFFRLQAQQAQQLNSAEILQGLNKLNIVGSVLYIAAHPDDENTRLLAYLSREKNLRTGYLSLTRGDGGQNLIGKEQSELLGLIRTQELLAARKIDGAEQFFTRANDFGYSKNPEETFNFWNKDSILSDVVWTIRQFKPDVIICRFPTTGEGGHGHHTASALLALEAFDAAADPHQFSQQLAYTQVWQARRIFWNTFNFGVTNTTSPDQLKIDVGLFNPLSGKSYGEISAESRSMHKSQGFGSARSRGSMIEYFKLLKGDSVKSDLFENINQTWSRFNSSGKIKKSIEDCISKFNAQHPEKSIGDLITTYNLLKQLDDNDPELKYWKNLKLAETETLIINCAGLWMEASAKDYFTTPGDSILITAQIIKRNQTQVKINSIQFINNDTIADYDLKYNEMLTVIDKEKYSENNTYSNPYWLNEKHQPGIYTVNDRLLIGKPENNPALKIIFHIEINGLKLSVERPLINKFTDPVKGEIYRPFEVLPPATVNISGKVFVFCDNAAKTIQFTIKANAKNISGQLKVSAPDGWKIDLQNNEFSLKDIGEETVLTATINCKTSQVEGQLKATLIFNGKAFDQKISRIEYDHIPYQFILSPAEAKLINIKIKKTGNIIGYIPGAGDDVPACLKQIGFEVTELSDEMLTNEDLSRYNAIVTGVRAYNTNDRLQVHYNKLMKYVQDGGNLIVQYNTNNRIGPVQAKIGPYPFTISRDRVTDENAEVRLTNPAHNALNFPNQIKLNDFDSWIQERGIYFASETDEKYETLIAMNDPGEKSNNGSLIIGKYGKGNFVYTGLAFFRQLPAGIPGAYRLFVNLVNLPANK